jgi:hypothetical protein
LSSVCNIFSSTSRTSTTLAFTMIFHSHFQTSKADTEFERFQSSILYHASDFTFRCCLKLDITPHLRTSFKKTVRQTSRATGLSFLDNLPNGTGNPDFMFGIENGRNWPSGFGLDSQSNGKKAQKQPEGGSLTQFLEPLTCSCG